MAPQLLENNPFLMGQEALTARKTAEALNWFRKAVEQHSTPVACSYLAYCEAKECGNYRETVALCMDAIKQEPKNPTIYLNLGRIYLLSGHKRSAMRSFHLGLRHGKSPEIAEELRLLGWRKPPPLPFLARDAALNKFLGKFLARIGLR